MKNKTLKFGGRIYNLHEEDDCEDVVIYESFGPNASAIARGATLKEACLNWMEDYDRVTSALREHFEESEAYMNYDEDVDDYNDAWNAFLKEIDGIDLFYDLKDGDYHRYVYWSQE